MRRAILLCVALLALPLASCKVPEATAAESDHGHIWTEPVCEVERCEGRCCAYKCLSYCTVCLMPRASGKTRCSGDQKAAHDHGAEPMGRFGGGGATGSYETCPPGQHDLGPEECGPWSKLRNGCSVRHCTRQCRKCLSNAGDRFDSDPPGCF